MKMDSRIKETRDGRLKVDIPFSLKDSLKSNFRSASFDSFSKSWSVSKSARKKLEIWIAEAESTGAFMTAEEFDEIELTEREQEKLRGKFEELERELSRAKSRLESIADIRARNAELLSHIEQTKESINAVSEQVTSEKAKAAAEEKTIIDAVSRVIDIDLVKKHASIMIKEAKSGKSQSGRERFDDSSIIIDEQLDKLHEAKLDSDTMRVLAYANYNRSSKDIEEWSAAITFKPLELEDDA